MLNELTVKNYRSIRNLHLKLKPVTVIVGANGSGKSNLYRALSLISRAASGGLARALAEEDGIPSALWSGKHAKGAKKEIELSVKTDVYEYELSMGRVPLGVRNLEPPSFFYDDLDIKKESINKVSGKRKGPIMNRSRQSVETVAIDGQMIDYTDTVPANESVLNRIQEPHKYPDLAAVKRELESWRFYHQLRTDQDSPLRLPQPGVVSPSLDDDGGNLVAVIATILCGQEAEVFKSALGYAFDGAEVIIENSPLGLKLSLTMDGITRPLSAGELSDGTLQYLALLAILNSPEPPPFLAINEPETSIHEDLLEALAQAIIQASQVSQIWITTHSRLLSDYILDLGGFEEVTLQKVNGETRLTGYGVDGELIEDEEP